MKNLQLQHLISCSSPELQNASWFCVESTLDGIYFYVFNEGIIYKVSQKENEITHQYSLEHLYPADVPEVVGMAYICLTNNVYIVFRNGDIIALENDKFELVGDVPSGLLAMEWSPDEELVVLISGDLKAMIMTSGFDPITEVDIHQEGFGEKAFITVGWGKKETQFHGSEGKAAAKAPTQVQPTPAFSWDDNKPRICWRGDGSLFAISTVHPVSGARQFRVFNREGSLQYTSEPTPGLEQALDWKPSGSLIASTQRLPNKHLVTFFEKNGLRHGEIVLPFGPDEIKVRELKWNTESTVLAIWCENLKQDADLCCLQLWTSSNYNWQLKQTLHFPCDQKLLSFAWDKDRSTTLHVFQQGSRCLEYQWKWCINHSNGAVEGDKASVAVIDGGRVKITNFSEAVIPPPMSAYSLKLPVNASSVVFASHSTHLCVALADNSVALFTNTPGLEDKTSRLKVESAQNGVGFADKCSKLIPQMLCPLEWDSEDLKELCQVSIPLGFHHWLWLQPNTLLCVVPGLCFSSMILVIAITEEKVVVRHCVPVPEPVLGLKAVPGSTDAVVFTESTYYRLEDPTDSANLEVLRTQSCVFHSTPGRCQQYEVVVIEGEIMVIGLTFMGQLYVNNNLAVKNCTLFFIHPHFLLFTTHQHQLMCIPLSKKAFESLVQQGVAGVTGTERQVERGARLVIAVEHLARVVLQMPRGNLEAVQPRALALFIVQKLLDEKQYGQAFDLMRRQRINLNIFYDHNPEVFLANIKEFINQVKNPTWLCLFISDLMDADVTKGMYAGYYEKQATPENKSQSKLDLVCGKMREALLETDEEGFLLPIITTYIKQSTAAIDGALNYIRRTKLAEQQGLKLAVSSDEALNYLFYIVDVYELFDVALGLYDFDLVMMVAAKSQKDPKEYVPFLNELRKLEENYQKFTIDKHLKRNESALLHLSKCGEEHSEECLSFIKTHNLYVAALKIFPSSHTLYERVCKDYAENLLREQCYMEAGILFTRCSCYSQAIQAYKKTGAWQSVLSLLPKLQLSDDELTLFYKELAHDLRERKQFKDAAAVFAEYLRDHEERVVSLCMGRAWGEALRVINSHNLTSLADSLVKPGVMEHYRSVASQLDSWQEQLTQQIARLLKVREEKAKKLMEEGEEAMALPECDMFSDTSSIQGSTQSRASSSLSKSSGKTYRSSKNKRKHERKLLSLKEGSPFEDLALIRALHELFSKAYQMRDEVRDLGLALLHFELDSLASELQTKLSALLDDMEQRKTDIWIPELVHNRAEALKIGPDSTSNSLAAGRQNMATVFNATSELEPHLCLPPTKTPSSWKLVCLS